MNEIQLQRLSATWDDIEQEPSRHDQTVYGKRTSCGVVACLAGHAIMRYRPDLLTGWDESGHTFMDTWMLTQRGMHPDEVAAEILGLDDDQAMALFSGARTRPQLRALINRLVETNGAATGDDLYAVIEFNGRGFEGAS